MPEGIDNGCVWQGSTDIVLRERAWHYNSYHFGRISRSAARSHFRLPQPEAGKGDRSHFGAGKARRAELS
jgi:hypothetical protein